VPDTPDDAERLAREEAERSRKSEADIASSRFAGDFAERQEMERRIRDVFEQRRAEISEACAVQHQEEIERTYPGMTGDALSAAEREGIAAIDAKWLELKARQLARIDREEQERLGPRLEAPENQPPKSRESGDGLGSYEENLQRIFDARRKEIKAACTADMNDELHATVGNIDDPEMTDYLRDIAKGIEAEYARRLQTQLDKIDREQQERLERTRRLYGRDD
jgi:hypothetical protein